MDILVNLQAFLAMADFGFSAAARNLKISTSVVAKRVTQLELRICTALFHRSTRQLATVPLTGSFCKAVGHKRCLPKKVLLPRDVKFELDWRHFLFVPQECSGYKSLTCHTTLVIERDVESSQILLISTQH